MAGGAVISPPTSNRSYLKGRQLIFPLCLAISLFFLWGFSYGLLDVLNKHFQNVLKITKLESTGLQIVYFGGGYFCFSPIAAELLKRKGYKITIVMGLALYAIGAIFFWPTAHYSNPNNAKQAFGGFIACTFVIACGLATLETSANSYATIIGDPKSASMRLQFCQSWNGVASFIGPLIASKIFFSGKNATNLVNVKYVYIAVSCAAALVAILFIFSKLPEADIDDEDPSDATDESKARIEPLWKQYNMIFAFVAQFCYVGAQVTIGSFFINYATENANFTDPEASNLLSYALITFTVGRFFGTALAHFFQADLILLIYSVISIALSAYTSAGYGRSAVIVLIALFFFESIMFPTIFVMGTANLGRHTRRGAGILIMGVSGGAVFPPIQGAIADAYSTRISFLVPMVGFIVVLAYALFHWIKHGFKMRRIQSTVDVHVVPTPGRKRESIIISQETVDAIIETQRKLSRVSQITDTLNHVSKITPIPSASETHTMDNTNQTVITTENL
ncbi:unnamed protein product [Rotaria sp. Silwood2]|nr:unnamed protein product [Rotaria sp. Silwood2]CAF2716072.1 unnamed protein product [Rotaria sp. Silwood2]CAF3130720.1 unnamed protein product [Rotaria sp. Silwood2]CAF3884079.1 unnamed protein product [Rotaria sp. Silwood2]CAF3923690.1 unnamed protein product [Rotaria sp. Silwood2]